MRNTHLKSVFIRVPLDMHSWVADEARNSRRSMNTVINEALGGMIASRAEQTRARKHDAAVSIVLASVAPSFGHCLVPKAGNKTRETEVMVQEPGSREFKLFARICDEHVELFV